MNFRIYHSLDLSRIPLLNAKAVYFTKLAYCCKSQCEKLIEGSIALALRLQESLLLCCTALCTTYIHAYKHIPRKSPCDRDFPREQSIFWLVQTKHKQSKTIAFNGTLSCQINVPLWPTFKQYRQIFHLFLCVTKIK